MLIIFVPLIRFSYLMYVYCVMKIVGIYLLGYHISVAIIIYSMKYFIILSKLNSYRAASYKATCEHASVCNTFCSQCSKCLCTVLHVVRMS